MATLDPQAILDGRSPGRPSVMLIIGMVVSSLCAMIALGLYAVFGGTGFVVGLGLAILPVPMLVAVVLALDRLEPEPPKDLIFAFLWGAGVAVLGALILNTLGYRYVTMPLFGDTDGRFWTAAVGAPIIEESLKGAVLFVLLWFRRNEIDGITDGIVYAAMVALGFAMMENISYYMQALDGPGGVKSLESVFVLRGLISPFGHPLFTAMTGLGVAYAANHRTGRTAALILGLLGAMLLHGMWNASTAFGVKGLLVVYLIDFGILLVLLVLIFNERRALVREIGQYLPLYQGTGLVSPQDIQMLATMPQRRVARRWARTVGGRFSARAMSDYQLAATELVLLHQRMDAGVIDQGFFASRQAELMNLMYWTRQAFLSQPGDPGAAPWGPSGFAPPPPHR
ncbi:PrsW family intramembrane metalloprotease [Actinocorallia longicatena]|uniref:PrsW family intramembrane metalloprotease n=1 Tax=Actinocorallia longicatena TaxID=111803 RepID=A0ABP6QM42_9ACTN